MNQMNDINDLVRFHAELFIEFHKGWRAARESGDASNERVRIAHFLLEHAAKLYRYTGDRSIMDGLRAKPADERRDLVISACHFFSLETVTETVRRLLSSQDFDDDDLCLLESSLMQLDSASEVLALSCELSFDLRTKSLDQKIMDALSEATEEVHNLDEVLRAWGETLLPALECFEGIRLLIKTPIQEDAWWLHDARDALIAVNRTTTEELKDLFDFVRRKDVLAKLTEFFARTEVAPVLAAAHTDTITLGVEGDDDIRIVASRRREGGLQFEMFYASTREKPPWAGTASIELFEGNSLLISLPFDYKTGVANTNTLLLEKVDALYLKINSLATLSKIVIWRQ